MAGPKDTLRERAAKASPITYVHADSPPFLLFQGTDDRIVNVKQAECFAKARREAGAKDVTYKRFEDVGHGVFTERGEVTRPAMEAFFARTLGPKAARAASAGSE